MKFLGNQSRCIIIVVVIVLFYIAYRSYSKYKNNKVKDSDSDDETSGLISKSENKNVNGKDSEINIDYDKINRTVENIMRKQI